MDTHTDMHLDWTFLRFQDDSDCARPEARIFNVGLEPCMIYPPPITEEDRVAAAAATAAAEAEEAAELAAVDAAAAEAAAMEEAMAAATRKKGKGGVGAKPMTVGAETKGANRGGSAKGGGSKDSGAKGGAKDGKEARERGLVKGAKGSGSITQRPSTGNTERSDGVEEGLDGKVCLWVHACLHVPVFVCAFMQVYVRLRVFVGMCMYV